MPLYEYYCDSCDGIFEELHSMREAGEPQPCPLCDHDSQRIMPTSFSAFTFRDGMIEELHSMREASEPQPCPLCDHDSERIMPTSFSAFTFRDGMPRRIPDDFTYWHHDGRKTKHMNTGGVPMNEHPELYKPDPKPEPTKADIDAMKEVAHLKGRHARMMKDSSLSPAIGQDGKPMLSPKFGASGHID